MSGFRPQNPFNNCMDASTQKTSFGTRCPKRSQVTSCSSSKKDKNPSLGPKVSFLGLPSATGSSNNLPGCQSGGTGHAKLQFRAPKMNIFISNVTAMRKHDTKLTSRNQLATTHFSREQQKSKHPKTSKWRPRTQLSKHSKTTTTQPSCLSSLGWGPPKESVILTFHFSTRGFVNPGYDSTREFPTPKYLFAKNGYVNPGHFNQRSIGALNWMGFL